MVSIDEVDVLSVCLCTAMNGPEIFGSFLVLPVAS